MEIKEAIQVLKDHNVWRRYDGEIGEEPKMTNPKILGIAIDKVISEFENLFISGVSNSTKLNKPKLSVKCLHCGKNFIVEMHHKCNTGYRKRNHSWQKITED